MKCRIAALGLLLVSCAAAAQPAARSQPPKKLAGYDVIVVKAFTIDKNPATSGAPEGLESMIHARAVEQLQAKAIFDGVIDAAPPAASEDDGRIDARVDLRVSPVQPVVTGVPGAEARDSTGADSRVVLNATILSFSKGNRAARYVTDGLGAGESKLQIRFTLTDAKTRAELMSWTDEGTFKGALSPFGGSANQATSGAANGVVKRLIKQIEKNR
jgi:Domain of unknown function (DUF4410)